MPNDSPLYSNNQEHLQLIKALRESELLRELAELLASSLDPTHILQVLVQRTTEFCEVKRCAVWLLDATRGIFLPSAYHLSTPPADKKDRQAADKIWQRSSLLFDDPLIDRLFAHNNMLIIEDLRAETSPQIQMLAEKFVVHSILLIALVREGRPVGMMSLDNPNKASTFSAQQQQFARAIGQQAAVAIDNAQLYQQAQKERSRAERLIGRAQSIYKVAMTVNAGKDLSTVLDTATQHLVNNTEAHGAAIALLSDETLTLASSHGLQHHKHSHAEFTTSLSDLPHCYSATTTGHPVFVTRKQAQGNELAWYEQVGIEQVLIVPLMTATHRRGRLAARDRNNGQHSRCVGFTFVSYPLSLRHPSKGDYAFAQDIATQCALAVERTHILAEVRQVATLSTERANTLDAVLNAMNEGILVLDMEGQIIVQNNTASHFLGMPLPNIEPFMTFLQRHPIYALNGQPLAPHELPFSRALSGSLIRGERFLTRRTDGSERVVEVNIVPFFDGEAQQIGIVCAFRDITEQVRVEGRIRGVLDTLLHAAEVVSGITDIKEILHRVLAMTLKALNCEQGVVQCYVQEQQIFTPLLSIGFSTEEETQWLSKQNSWLMPEIEQYTGFRSQILAGHATLVNEEQCPQHPNMFHNTMILAAPITHDNQLLGVIMLDRSPDARTEEALLSSTINQRKRDFNVWDIAVVEGIAQFAGLAIEQTRWQQEAAIARMNEETMRETNELKDEFLAITAHEFRTPLAIILAHSQMMARLLRRSLDQDIIERLYESINSIETQTHQLTNIVNTFLEVTLLKRGQIDLSMETIDLEEIVAQSVNNNKATAMLYQISALVKQARHPYIVQGDRMRLLQIFANLLQNAIKYSPPDLPIQVIMFQDTTLEGSPVIKVNIVDKGIGIPKEAQSHLFERFYRAPNIVGSQTRGVGLGLYLVAEFLRLHGGTIYVESSGMAGQGSCFTLTLPLLVEKTEPD